jgi:hypothetical protein
MGLKLYLVIGLRGKKQQTEIFITSVAYLALGLMAIANELFEFGM